MLLNPPVFKNPSSILPIAVDFSNAVPADVTLDTIDVSAFETDGDSIDLVEGTPSISGLIANALITGGTAGTQYFLRFTATFSDGTILVDYIPLFNDKALY